METHRDPVISVRKANSVFDILVRDCGAAEEDRGNFLWCMNGGCEEYRCCPRLGFGGKFRPATMSVDYYPEDKTAERDSIARTVNQKLSRLNAT